MKKTGLVTEVNKNFACILTQSGEFTKVKFTDSVPVLGEIYCGDIYLSSKPRLSLIAAIVAFILLTGSLFSYMVPAYAVTVKINPSIKLKVNLWNRIIKAEGLNNDGNKLLASLNLNNMSPDNAFEKLIAEAIHDNYINEDYISMGKFIKVTIEGKKSIPKEFTDVYQILKNKNLNFEITSEDNTISSSSSNTTPNSDTDMTPNKSTTDMKASKNNTSENEGKQSEKKDGKSSNPSTNKSDNNGNNKTNTNNGKVKQETHENSKENIDNNKTSDEGNASDKNGPVNSHSDSKKGSAPNSPGTNNKKNN